MKLFKYKEYIVTFKGNWEHSFDFLVFNKSVFNFDVTNLDYYRFLLHNKETCYINWNDKTSTFSKIVCKKIDIDDLVNILCFCENLLDTIRIKESTCQIKELPEELFRIDLYESKEINKLVYIKNDANTSCSTLLEYNKQGQLMYCGNDLRLPFQKLIDFITKDYNIIKHKMLFKQSLDRIYYHPLLERTKSENIEFYQQNLIE